MSIFTLFLSATIAFLDRVGDKLNENEISKCFKPLNLDCRNAVKYFWGLNPLNKNEPCSGKMGLKHLRVAVHKARHHLELSFYMQKKIKRAKSFDQCQPARTAQADMGRNFS